MSLTKWNELQLKFDLDLNEDQDVAVDQAITPEEARQISEAARTKIASGELGLKSSEWFPEYLKLIEQGWPWRVACYIAWAASPKVNRKPSTLQDLATQVLGLASPRVIYTWRRRFPAIDNVIAMMQAAPLWEHRADVLKALADMASKEDYKAHNDRKLFLEMIGDYVPKSKLELGKSGKGSDLSELSDDDLASMVGEEEESSNKSEVSSDQSEEEDAA